MASLPVNPAQRALVKRIEAHLRRTKEHPYNWSARVMGDKTFLWKLKNLGRMPFSSTVKKIEMAMKRREAALARAALAQAVAAGLVTPHRGRQIRRGD